MILPVLFSLVDLLCLVRYWSTTVEECLSGGWPNTETEERRGTKMEREVRSPVVGDSVFHRPLPSLSPLSVDKGKLLVVRSFSVPSCR